MMQQLDVQKQLKVQPHKHNSLAGSDIKLIRVQTCLQAAFLYNAFMSMVCVLLSGSNTL